MKRIGAPLALLLSAAALTGGSAGAMPTQPPQGETPAPERKTTLADVEEDVMCPVCGTLLGLSSAPAADRQRVFIKRLIRQGLDEQQIEDALVAEYGPQVLALPDDEGINAWAYLVPLIGLIGGAVGVGIAVFLWRRNPDGGSGEGPTPAPEGSAAERLDRDLERFDG